LCNNNWWFPQSYCLSSRASLVYIFWKKNYLSCWRMYCWQHGRLCGLCMVELPHILPVAWRLSPPAWWIGWNWLVLCPPWSTHLKPDLLCVLSGRYCSHEECEHVAGALAFDSSGCDNSKIHAWNSWHHRASRMESIFREFCKHSLNSEMMCWNLISSVLNYVAHLIWFPDTFFTIMK
jgi:hypothetical protein